VIRELVLALAERRSGGAQNVVGLGGFDTDQRFNRGVTM
jgi:hypothetical protein